MALEGKNHNFACPCLFFFYYLKIDGIRLDCSGPLILQSPSGVVDHAKKDQFSSVTQSSPTLCNPMNCSMPGFPVHYQLPELAQTHVHQVGDAIQPSHPLSSPSPETCSVFLPGKFRGQRCLVGSNPTANSRTQLSNFTFFLFLLLPSIFPSIRIFSNELVLHSRWPKYWSFSFSISPSNEYSGLISFRIDWFDLLAEKLKRVVVIK